MAKLIKQLFQFAIALIELVLVARFILKLLGASANSDLVAWLYQTSFPFLQPFLFAFPNPSVQGRFVIEFSTLFALFAYAVLNYIVQEVLDIVIKK